MIFLRWKRIGCGPRLLLSCLLLIGIYTAWWWIDSAHTCETQDEYNLRGICLMRIQERAEQGDSAAQWVYGNYLMSQSRQQEAVTWHLKAMHGVRYGLGLNGNMEAYCDRIPGFEASNIEKAMLRVAPESPDAHLRLLQLYVYPGCGAFDLDKASAQFPLLTQCAHLTIAHYLNFAGEKNHHVSSTTRTAIRKNMTLCEKELAGKIPPMTTVQEILRVRREDIDAMARSLDSMR